MNISGFKDQHGGLAAGFDDVWHVAFTTGVSCDVRIERERKRRAVLRGIPDGYSVRVAVDIHVRPDHFKLRGVRERSCYTPPVL